MLTNTAVDLSEASIRQAYENAIATLNRLEAKSNVVQYSANDQSNIKYVHVIEERQKFLERSGITLEKLDTLSVIHVAGTKGKGSTCALTESILRHLNVKTGFLSSPHMVNVNERIRINGEPISQQLFTEYFWRVYNRFKAAKEHATDMPSFYIFLASMAYNVFLHEKVDVAVVEVGAGGEYDCTNMVRNTKTVGITSLGLDHTHILGCTIDAIAWQKSGIIKPNCSVYTAQQPDGCEAVIKSRANENNASFHYVPSFSEYKCKNASALEEINRNPAKKINASLAIQLCYDWIKRNPSKINSEQVWESLHAVDGGLTLADDIVTGLLNCVWPGRCQTHELDNKTLYIDGAHTHDSITLCSQWFKERQSQTAAKQILVFNVIGNRNGNEFLDILHQNINFDMALFTPNISSLTSKAIDNTYRKPQPNKTVEHSNYWQSLDETNVSHTFDSVADLFLFLDNSFAHEEIDVLITGSLHLVGETLRWLREASESNGI